MKVLFVIIALLVSPVFFPQGADAQNTVKTIRVGYVPLIAQLPLIVSYDNDRLNYSKVDVRLVKYRSFTSLEAALRVGAIDIADLPLPVVFDIAGDGIAIKILGQCHSGGSVLEGVGLSALPALRGKIIGVPGLRSNENLELIQALSREKLRYGLDYKTIKVPFNTILQNLQTGRINAMYFPEPYGAMAEKNHLVRQMDNQEKNFAGRLTTVLSARADILQENYREAMEEWTRSLVEACAFIENDIKNLSAEQTAILQEPYFGFNREVISSSLARRRGNIHFSFVMPEKTLLQLYLRQTLEVQMTLRGLDVNVLIPHNILKMEEESPVR
jgi:ABC-type nitrate/sulfonate/bicarbonate transport system substrate-binding protein